MSSDFTFVFGEVHWTNYAARFHCSGSSPLLRVYMNISFDETF